MGTICFKEKFKSNPKVEETEVETYQKFINHIKAQIPSSDEEL